MRPKTLALQNQVKLTQVFEKLAHLISSSYSDSVIKLHVCYFPFAHHA